MSKKFIFLTSFVLVLALAGSNVVFGGIVIERQIIKSSDDNEEKDPAGDAEGVDSTDLEFPYEDEGTPPTDPMIVAMRFEDISIPKGSPILEAWIRFDVDETKNGTDPVSLIIEGELSPDAATFAGTDSEIANRPRTAAKVVWVPDDWATTHEKHFTSNIASVIEEIVSQDGWRFGNALVLIIRDDPDNPSKGIRCAEAWDGAGGNTDRIPLLHIEFTSKAAMQPDPVDGIPYEDTWATLGWSPGETAVSHDVYFSDNFDDVNDRAESAFQGNQPSTVFVVGFPGMPYPDGLVSGTTYYWRIDEVEADGTTKHEGPIWSFWIPLRTAYNPDPADGAKYVSTDVELSWAGGFGAKLHYVYFGDNFDDVNNATGGLLQGATTYTPGTLEMDKTYYWRVDESDPPITHKGDVWSFKTIPVITITDPNLIGWWKFDEGSGGTAIDFSGHGNDGKLGGGQNWVPGIMGGALDLRGLDYVSINGVVDDITSNDITLSAWIKTTQAGEGNVFASNDSGSGHVLQFGIDNGNVWVDDGPDVEFPPAVNDDQWHMITLVMKGSKIFVYTDGVQVGTITTIIDITTETRWSIGQEWDDSTPSNLYIGMVDDARFYDVALTEDEVKELMRGDPLVAWDPKPANGSTPSLEDATSVSWSPGDNASGHDVYFGTDKDAVDNADASDTTGIYRGRQSVTSYSPPEGFEWGGGPYYWRVDEYNTDATISKGGIWSFTVADFIVVDDIEDYNDYPPDEVWATWVDGYEVPTNGSTIGYPNPDWNAGEHYVETTNVHGGGQSMPFLYDNNFKYSEATRTLAYPRNWTEQGVGVLSLWFYGDSANAVERMYVNLNGIATVYHDDPSAAQIAAWTEWTIDLQEFAAQGVNLANVNTISIGFGDKNNLQAGGSGTVLFDDIRLYRPAP
jgi:hypothetical protein